MRTITAGLLATSLVVSSAFAATESVSLAPLPAGKPAGAKEAAMLGPNALLILISAGIIIGGIALAVSQNANGITSGITTGTTTGTTTTGTTTTGTTTTTTATTTGTAS